MGQFAWVTLATNDSYALGSLVLANSLKKVNTQHQLAVLVTPGVTASMRDKLHATFNLVENVNVLDSKDAAHLALLQRPELGVTFTKLHCWRLTQFEKCVFLDADTYVLQNCDELFQREELSAAPDVGWPDCFNSGVFVYRPNTQTFEKLMQFAVAKGSFDGGDQGLLNSFFSEWAKGDNSKRLPFIYNTCSTACYSYLPAFKQFGSDVKILHFIGQLKPWLISFDPLTRKASPPQEYQHLTEYLNLWWTTFCNEVHPKLTIEMGGLAGALANLKLGSARTPEQEAYEDSCRRNYWEHGSIDYLGKDSFDNIWKKITQTLESKNDSADSQRRERTPTPQPEEKLPKEAKKEETAAGSPETTVQFDPVSNTQIVTERTGSATHETITTVTPGGRTRLETKTKFDPVVIPGEETEEEEEEEEEETYEETGPTKTTKTTTTTSAAPTVTPPAQTVEKGSKTATTTATTTKPASPPVTPPTQTVEKGSKTTTTTETTTTTVDPNVAKKLAETAGKTTVVKQKLPTGEEIEVKTTTSADGKSTTQKKTVTQPDEEEEEEEYEEVETVEPTKVTTTTTTTTVTGTKKATPKVTIPEKKEDKKPVPKTPTVTSPTPPQTPASPSSSEQESRIPTAAKSSGGPVAPPRKKQEGPKKPAKK